MTANKFNKVLSCLLPRKRWSKLKKRVENLFDSRLGACIYCCANSPDASWWITVSGEKIWEFPRHEEFSYCDWDTRTIAEILREYVDTPRSELLDKKFDKDLFGLTDVLKSLDRRISKNKKDVSTPKKAD